ncbi:MAG: 50S ribosomal protein L21 [Candidatus Euphemobacter frigidus]|nr:50S ribosomal protein L21 [Candidatus Euphemobacter frigidus]MDP8275068.1 50S ribosomal protein L21 [Candidatus Euphemobacter frigidus]
MNFAVVKIAGKQYLIQKNDNIETPRLPGQVGDEVTFTQVLLYWDGKNILLGHPHLDGYAVKGRILEFGRGPKLIVYKYKRRKDSHRKMGHRQDLCRVEIRQIVTPGASEKPPAGKTGGAKAKPAKKVSTAPAAKAPAKKKKAAPRKKPVAKKKEAGKEKPAPAKKTKK